MKLTKRFTIGLMIICAFFGAILLGMAKTQPTSAAEETEETKLICKGDIDRNGKLEMKDVILASQYLAGVAILDAEQIEIGDVVLGDGKITLEDLVKICQRIAGENVVFDSCKHNNKESVVTEPTCTEGGYTTYTCLSCGYIWTENPTNPTGHSPAEAVQENRTEATCLTTGSYDSVVYCETCHTELSRETKTIPSKGHTEAEAVEENRVEATCAKTGSYDLVVKCSVCTLELSRETKKIEKTDHKNVVIDAEVPATCTQIGWTEGSHCGDCDTIIKAQEVINVAAHTEETIPAVEVGCTTSGWTEGKKCSVCNTILEAQTLIPAEGHTTEETRTIVTTASCTQEGSERVVTACTKCKDVFGDETVAIPMLPHDYQGNEEIPADLEFCKDIKKTCTICNTAFIFELSGNDNRTRHILSSEIVSATDTDCSDVKFTCTNTECAHWYYQRSNNQQPTKHAWPETGKTLTAATCVTDGVELYVCKNCSSTKNGTLPATGHHYNEGVVVPATDAYCADTRYDCNDCDYFYYARRGKDSANATELTAHNLTVTTVDATCTKDGSTTTSCGNADCGYTKTETISALGHDYKVETIAGTATTCVDTKYTCSRGDSTYYVGYGESHATKPTEHDWQKTTTNVATCYSKGMEVYTCSHCKATKNVEIPKLEHDYNGTGVTVEATDTYCKDTKYTCKHCGKMYYERRGKDSANATELTAHTLTTTTKAATCTEDGETKYTCTNANCGYTKTVTIPKTGHNYKTEAVAASAEKNQCADVKNICQNAGCGDWYYSLSKNQNRTTHAWPTTGTELNAATCVTEGVELYVCQKCNTTKSKTISALGHDYGEGVECLVSELYCPDIQYQCSRCNDVYYKGHIPGHQSIVPTMHAWNSGEVTKEVKCTTNGTMTYTCLNGDCGYTKEEPIIATGHNYENGVCTVCGVKVSGVVTFDPAVYGSLNYSLQSDGTYMVTGKGTWKLTDLIVIPDTYNGKPVTAIVGNAFKDNTTIKYLEMPDSVKKIGSGAFSGCTNLNYTTYDNATYLGNSSNKYVALIKATGTSITACAIHPNTKVIYGAAFSGCANLTSIAIPEGVISIGDGAFYNCSALKSVTIPNSLIDFGTNAVFNGCNALEYNTYSNAKYLGNSTNKYVVLMKATDTSITSCTIHPATKIIGYQAFYNCTKLNGNLTIPDGLKQIGGYAFYGCTALVNVTIPASVNQIGNYSFEKCTALTGIYITDIVAWSRITFVDFYANPLRIAHNLYLNGKLLTDLVIPDSVTSIGNYAFLECTSLTSVTIPDSVTSIGQQAFQSCGEITSLTLGRGMTELNGSWFGGCSFTDVVTIPDCVTILGDAFNGCSIPSLVLPVSLTSIGKGAFEVSDVTAVYYKGTKEHGWGISIGGMNYAFEETPKYYYSETSASGCWHYVDGVPTLW